MKSKNWLESFGHAWDGIYKTAVRERNFKIQIIMGIAAVLACIFFQVDTLHFIGVLLSVFFVLAMELMNTAVEALTDLICGNKPHPLAKLAKDVAAGAVLLAAFQAVFVAILVAIHVIGRYV